MNYHDLKKDIFYLRKAFFEYHHGVKYIYNRYYFSHKILSLNRILEKAVNYPDLSIHVLVGKRDSVMMLWSLASFYEVAQMYGQLYIHSDGTLTERARGWIKRLFPSAIIIEPLEFIKHYGNTLRQYPVIEAFRTRFPQYFLLKKLIDPYFISPASCRLVIDSDLIWLARPQALNDCLDNGCKNSFMTANLTPTAFYFQNNEVMDAGLSSYNSGIVLYRKQNFNLSRLTEFLNKVDTSRPQNVHFIEQAGYSYCLDKLTGLPLPAYHVKGPVTAETVVKHYTGPRRPLFYIEGIELLRRRLGIQ